MLHFKKTTLAISVGFALGIGVTQTANAYNTLTVLENLGWTSYQVKDVNDEGQVLGNAIAYKKSSIFQDNYVAYPVIWTDTTTTVLHPLDSRSISAVGINNLGQVWGKANRMNGANQSQAYLWDGDTTIVTGTNNEYLIDVNNFGSGLGYNGANTAYLWNGTTYTEIDPSIITRPVSMNDLGQVIGTNTLGSEGARRSVLWDGTTTTELNGLFGYYGVNGTVPNAINNSGQVVGLGYGYNYSPSQEAILWDGSNPTMLQGFSNEPKFLWSNNMSSANDINDNGIVVGWAQVAREFATDPAGQQAVMWSGTSVINLNSLIDPSLGITLWSADAINNNGLIVGNAYNSLRELVPYKLSVADMQLSPAVGVEVPTIPEPSTYAMLLAGMGMIGWTTRRRKTN